MFAGARETPGAAPEVCEHVDSRAGRAPGSLRAMIDSSLYDDPELYDLLFGAEPGVVDFYVQQARHARGPILELAAVHGSDRYPWLVAGDVVELTVEGNPRPVKDMQLSAADKTAVEPQ